MPTKPHARTSRQKLSMPEGGSLIYGRGSGNFGCSMVVISSRFSPTAICACADVRPSAMRVWSTRRRNGERGSSGVSAQPRSGASRAFHSLGPPVAKLFLTIAEGLPRPPSLGHCRAKQLVVNWVVAEAVEDLMGGIVTLLVIIYLVGIGSSSRQRSRENGMPAPRRNSFRAFCSNCLWPLPGR